MRARASASRLSSHTPGTKSAMTVTEVDAAQGIGIAGGERRVRQALAGAGFGAAATHALDGDPFDVFYVAGRD
jgi:hypothetical protein